MEVLIILIVFGIIGYFFYQSLPNQKFQKAQSLFEKGNLTDSIIILDEIFDKHPDAPAKLGECKLKQGIQIKLSNENGAIKYFNEVIDLKNRLANRASKIKYNLVEVEAKALLKLHKSNSIIQLH